MRDVPSATNLRGFLYYHLPPGAPPLAAEIRFRVTGSPDPAFFSSSPDLMTQHGLPWRIPLLNLVRHRRRLHPDPLWLVLVEDGLVSEDQLLSDSQVDVPKESSPSMNTRLIYGFGQPFLLDFSACEPQFRLMAATLHKDILDVFQRCGLTEGTALCCFEKSPLPAEKGGPTVVLRVLRILDPFAFFPDPEGLWPSDRVPLAVLEPREGELLRMHRLRKDVVWTPPKRLEKFGILYDNEARANAA
ncbi:uncharacterized protein TRAVEDRAFT_45026 [Trametes versicolor FP-101664 SS1]|uniref:uncharacterized protein n=1 Tax=Trametes versicolor (strain FP-101664) TaxID=717944 RepID=UPI0004623DDD|nr:uncharacterized protein TRAVEDRAFT_45026 [Trametes versicolor FP-101664 SS1]EIW62191.1 hypothetical protein TRAVEDRAFT_45026 [Trametes versicolor FP-101664 SS1]